MKTLAAIAVLILTGCSSGNLEYTKESACAQWKRVGYECVGYEGFQWGFWGFNDYGGAYVWHTLRRTEAPGIIYTGAIQRWGNEYHVYGPTAIDAIKPSRR